jgi:hypothetical protein
MSDQRKAVIKNADMVDSMQQDAVDIASKALSEYNIEKVRNICIIYYVERKYDAFIHLVIHFISSKQKEYHFGRYENIHKNKNSFG